jgi:hypothetical protein
MSEGGHGTDGGLFDSLDARLNVFALANGMDLAKGERYRRLEWFTEGLERGILIEAADAGTLRVAVQTWRTGRTDASTERVVAEGLAPDEIGGVLGDAIEAANALEGPADDG